MTRTLSWQVWHAWFGVSGWAYLNADEVGLRSAWFEVVS